MIEVDVVAYTENNKAENGKAEAGEHPAEPITIKKYANRRLYNTDTSSYVTLEHLSEMVREGVDFTVQDAKSGDDITRSVLAQIIFDQESRGQSLLPVQFLRKLIRFYGDQMQGFLPPYLEMSMESFTKTQEHMRENISRSFGARTPLAAFEEQAQRNMAIFQQAMKTWTPFAPGMKPPEAPASEASAAADDELAMLRKQMETMQKQLDLMALRKPGA